MNQQLELSFQSFLGSYLGSTCQNFHRIYSKETGKEVETVISSNDFSPWSNLVLRKYWTDQTSYDVCEVVVTCRVASWLKVSFIPFSVQDKMRVIGPILLQPFDFEPNLTKERPLNESLVCLNVEIPKNKTLCAFSHFFNKYIYFSVANE